MILTWPFVLAIDKNISGVYNLTVLHEDYDSEITIFPVKCFFM